MARVKITEYRAKKIILGESYKGISVRADEKIMLPTKGTWVAKVDEGVKKRMKQGLLVVGVDAAKARRAFAAWKKKGFTQFLLEPLVPHKSEDEQYLSLERVREGIRILHAREGGIDIEEHPEKVRMHLIREREDVATVARETNMPLDFLQKLVHAFNERFFAFLELNPLVVKSGSAMPLDAAALVDSAGEFFTDAWSGDDVVQTRYVHVEEKRVATLDATTPASLKLNVLNKNGALFFLLSGGGGSIVIVDDVQLAGAGGLIGNYGEYSGGPTREETYLYAKEVIALILASKAPKKALVIAGGVANFTDIKKTFAGIVDALAEVAQRLRAEKVKVFVRRGGPNEAAGLAHMEAYLKQEKLLGAVYGSDVMITKAVSEALHSVGV